MILMRREKSERSDRIFMVAVVIVSLFRFISVVYRLSAIVSWFYCMQKDLKIGDDESIWKMKNNFEQVRKGLRYRNPEDLEQPKDIFICGELIRANSNNVFPNGDPPHVQLQLTLQCQG